MRSPEEGGGWRGSRSGVGGWPSPSQPIPSHPSQPAGDKCMSAVCLEALADTSELLAMSMLVLKWCRCAAVVASKYGPWAHAMRCDVMVGSAAEQVNRPVGWMDGWIVVAAVSHLCCSAESYLNDMHIVLSVGVFSVFGARNPRCLSAWLSVVAGICACGLINWQKDRLESA